MTTMILNVNSFSVRLLDELIYSSVNIWYGVGLAIIISAILLSILYLIKSGKEISILSFLISIILIPLLSYHLSYMFGAIELKNNINEIELMLEGFSFIDNPNTIINDLKGIISGLTDDLEAAYIEDNDFSESFVSYAKEYINNFILVRIFWSVLFTIIGTIAMILVSDYGVSKKSGYSSLRKERVVSRRVSESRRQRRI